MDDSVGNDGSSGLFRERSLACFCAKPRQDDSVYAWMRSTCLVAVCWGRHWRRCMIIDDFIIVTGSISALHTMCDRITIIECWSPFLYLY